MGSALKGFAAMYQHRLSEKRNYESLIKSYPSIIFV